MKHTVHGSLIATAKWYELRRCKAYGDPYDLKLDVTVVNGQCHVEGLQIEGRPDKQLIRDIVSFIKSIGFNVCYYMRMKEDGTSVLVTRRIR